MHVLSCRVRDEVLIGDAVRIQILEVAEDHVRLGVHSPDQVPEYQEQIIYLTDLAGDAMDGSADSDRRLVGA